jgi:MFS family permease
VATPSFPRAPEEPSTRFANFALGLDAAFCNIVGLVLTLTGSFMSDWLGLAGWIITVFGIVVLLWSFVVTLFANRRVSRRREVDLVLRVNIVFIVLAIVVIALPDTLTTDGRVVLGIGTAIVAGFAVAQFLARRDLD